MNTEAITNNSTTGLDFAVPRLPQDALNRLPNYCPKPTERNLATQYYFWNRELIKENNDLKQKNKTLKDKIQQVEQDNNRLKEKVEKLKLEKERFLRMIFKPKRVKTNTTNKPEKQIRTKSSYQRAKPKVIDEYREAKLTKCPHCQSKLIKQTSSYQRTIEDMPDLEQQRARVIQYTINRYYCRTCKKIVQAKPKDVLPRSRLGLNTLLYVLYSRYRLRLTQELIRENLKIHYQLEVSDGQINNLLNKGEQVFKEKWKEIIEKVRSSPVVNADETGWKINGDNCWLWAFVGEQAVRYTISEFRGKGVPKEVLGDDFQGTVVSDFYSAYNQFSNKQRCWVHLLRKSRELTEQKQTQTRLKFNQLLIDIYQQINNFKANPKTTPEQRNNQANLVCQQLLKLSQIKTKDKNLQRICKLIFKHQQELVLCVRDFRVPPENNKAERAIRPSVVIRKISGGSRSKQGAIAHETNLSVIETLRQEKQNLFLAMKQLALGYIASIG